MSFNILDTVKGYLTPELISKASSFLGESDNSMLKALSGILPTVLSGMISKSASGGHGATEVFNTASTAHSSGLLGSLGNVFDDGGGMLNKGADILKGLFGDKINGIISTVSSFAGIKNSSASSLFSMAAPAAAGALGKHAAENNLDAGGLASLLGSQKSTIMSMLPAGLGGIASMLGLGNASDGVSAVSGAALDKAKQVYTHTDDRVKKAGSLDFLAWLLPLLLAAILVWWFLLGGKAGCNKTNTGEPGSDTAHIAAGPTENTPSDYMASLTLPAVTIDTATGIVNYDLGKEIEFTLPDGAKFVAAERGFESQLLEFIKNGSIDTVNKSANWMNMFDVQFKSGGNTYTGKAEAQLKNCAAILKAYPAVKIKLGGYTDNTGSASANTRISQQRADKVKADIIKMGAATGQVTEAVGYGPEFPVCEANDTKECQARNRRVACKVAVK